MLDTLVKQKKNNEKSEVGKVSMKLEQLSHFPILDFFKLILFNLNLLISQLYFPTTCKPQTVTKQVGSKQKTSSSIKKVPLNDGPCFKNGFHSLWTKRWVALQTYLDRV